MGLRRHKVGREASPTSAAGSTHLSRFDGEVAIIYDHYMARGIKIQGWSAHYDKWVLTQLVKLKLETSEHAVVARIVREWLERHADEHHAIGLTREAFLRESQGEGAKLYSFSRTETSEQTNEPKEEGSARSAG